MALCNRLSPLAFVPHDSLFEPHWPHQTSSDFGTFVLTESVIPLGAYTAPSSKHLCACCILAGLFAFETESQNIVQAGLEPQQPKGMPECHPSR